MGPTGPTGTNYFNRDPSGNISYTKGSTTLSQLYISTVDYNRLPMGMLQQTEIASSTIKSQIDATFTNNPLNLISSTTFTVIGLGSHRKIRTHISLNVDSSYSSVDSPKNIFITLYDQDGNKLKNFSHAYSQNLCTSLNFYHYSSIAPGVTQTFSVFAATNSTTSDTYISGNGGTNTYSASNVAPTSYLTIEDIGVG
jgi:hypothetical protein